MTQKIDTIEAIASEYDVIVFDQWGVLHNGTTPYPFAIGAIEALKSKSPNVAVLSNSGKRSEPNAARISQMGFDANSFDYVMTSGEALWRDIDQSHISERIFEPVERDPGDAARWSDGLPISFSSHGAEAVLLMGLPDGSELKDWEVAIQSWRDQDLPLYCSNPDRKSPREGGLVMSPGSLAFAFQEIGGSVTFYGKPHVGVFKALENVFGSGRYLMVGDSLEHDIAGAQSAGWDSLLIEGGLYAETFADADGEKVLATLIAEKQCKPPTYRIKELC